MSHTSLHNTLHVFHLEVALWGPAISSETGAVLWRARHHLVTPTDLSGGRIRSTACGVCSPGRGQFNPSADGESGNKHSYIFTPYFLQIHCCNSIIHLVQSVRIHRCLQNPVALSFTVSEWMKTADSGLILKRFFTPLLQRYAGRWWLSTRLSCPSYD